MAPLPPSTAPRAAPRSWWRRNQIAITPWLFLAPGILFFAIYVLIPVFQSFNVSLYDWDGLGAAEYVGLRNYEEMYWDDAFYTSLRNNLIWLVLYLLAIPAGLAIALFLNQTVTGIRIYKSLFFFPFVISQVVVGLVFSWFYDPSFGLLNVMLGWVGLGPVNVLGDESYVTYGIIAAGLWPQTAYCMILYLTGLNAVDPEQIEAGRLDNAKGFRMLWHIILPQLRPATFIAFVVTIIGALRSFDLISIMTAGGPFGQSRVLSFYMFEVALSEYGFRMGYGAAIAWCCS
ncbi:glycerol-3-phosphate ABC transporter, permease protein UgpA [Limimaricola cinnabarinus LL-001]|uniref:Glycerol-3-phosphate ABC transporter, permease protein UgpA n=1 Tax=Limimaricola cinnabarinus LL-001 TaxID=1337093 RepID=U2YMC8_9RHOB|nr:glycerol-3-phosphate ABC transporter, permease protein UgpA [Limimaricola cinnabarinus LL-001]